MAADTLVLLNPGCNYGTGRSRWERVASDVLDRLGGAEVEDISPAGIEEQVARAAGLGVRFYVAAGGDGTVNFLLNAVMRLPDRDGTVIGAVGLGSSNDFHKPRTEVVRDIPVRIDRAGARRSDVMEAELVDASGAARTRYCLLNASIGITAEANARFNERHAFTRAVQRVTVNGAIFLTALRTLFAFRDVDCVLSLDGAPGRACRVSNLGVLKRCHFAGGLCYDTPVEPDDGRLAANFVCGLNLAERVGTLVALSRGRFRGRKKSECHIVTGLGVSADRPFALEMDGEVERVTGVTFRLVPKAVGVCL